MNSLETEVVISKEDGPDFGRRELVMKVSPNIQRLKQVFDSGDDQEPMDAVENLDKESMNEQLTKVNMFEGESVKMTNIP